MADVFVGEMVAVATEFPGQSALAEPLAAGSGVVKDKARIAEQAGIRPSAGSGRAGNGAYGQHRGGGGRGQHQPGRGALPGGVLAGHLQHQQADG